MISHVSSRPNWYSTHAVCNQSFFFFFLVLFFSKIAILVIWKPVTAKPRVKIKLFWFHLKFYGPYGTLKNQDWTSNQPYLPEGFKVFWSSRNSSFVFNQIFVYGSLMGVDHRSEKKI